MEPITESRYISTRNGYFVSKREQPVRFWFNGEGVGAVRPSVAAFALLMEAQLRKHDDRPGWEGDNWSDLWAHLERERAEFDQAGVETAPAEGADEANMLMMLVQNCGGLDVLLRHLLSLE